MVFVGPVSLYFLLEVMWSVFPEEKCGLFFDPCCYKMPIYCSSALSDVRERAAVVSMVSAAVMYDVTACCREKKLLDCSCNYSLPILVSSFVEGKSHNVYGGCSDRLDIPAKRTMSLMKMDTPSSEDCARADTHNAKVGMKVGTECAHCS